MDKEELRLYITKLGVKLVGLAYLDCFSDAPKGFSPMDVLPESKQ